MAFRTLTFVVRMPDDLSPDQEDFYLEDGRRLLTDDEVMFWGSEDGITPKALELGADPALWAASDEVPAQSEIEASFAPQAWQNDYAVPVDPQGETKWYISVSSAENLFNDKLELYEFGSATPIRGLNVVHDLDWLKADFYAPEWVKNWQGPFDIYVRVPDEGAGQS